mmetsp:Transcript_33547/g.94381  ORF Transcript_33547/g.94381 Transcript_33547/m.94381 type:complete len:314 (-) Transcript_33547:939-1880(-)
MYTRYSFSCSASSRNNCPTCSCCRFRCSRTHFSSFCKKDECSFTSESTMLKIFTRSSRVASFPFFSSGSMYTFTITRRFSTYFFSVEMISLTTRKRCAACLLLPPPSSSTMAPGSCVFPAPTSLWSFSCSNGNLRLCSAISTASSSSPDASLDRPSSSGMAPNRSRSWRQSSFRATVAKTSMMCCKRTDSTWSFSFTSIRIIASVPPYWVKHSSIWSLRRARFIRSDAVCSLRAPRLVTSCWTRDVALAAVRMGSTLASSTERLVRDCVALSFTRRSLDERRRERVSISPPFTSLLRIFPLRYDSMQRMLVHS